MLYTKNIETLMRLLYNDKIDAAEINNIREDVEYYVENYEDGTISSGVKTRAVIRISF